VKCWKCGELGHTSRAHYDTSNANYSGSRSLGKPMAVNACEVQNTEYYDECCDETEPAQDSVPVNQCIVLEPRTECVGPDVESSEGPLFNFIPERDRSYNDTIGLVPESSVVMTCESETGVNSLMPPLEYVSIDLEGSDQTYKAMLDSGTMVAVAKSSLIPQELRHSVGKTRLQGAFGECVDAELCLLKVRLHPQGAETIFAPILFALTDALASKECDMLLPAVAVKELQMCNDICVVQTVPTLIVIPIVRLALVVTAVAR